MSRSLFAMAASALLAAPAIAGSYSAKPVAPAEGRIIARDIVWSCGPAACQGATEESRPAVLCEGLAKRAGRLESFVANGRAFGPAELDRCNSAARDGGPATVAQQR
ncbi:MAG TPA: hypothetical protein VM346_08465 [Sphingomicrobium sp.]|nr:hypothetical protein [Sphingomicrobium sp.]